MKRYVILLGTLAAGSALVIAGCSHGVVGCASNEDCPGGHLCDTDKCRKLCDDDDVCPTGQHCDGTFCAEGASQKPIIEAVRGNSATEDCTPVAGGPTVPCVQDAIVVIGQNVVGGSYQLEARETGHPNFTLEAVANTGNSVNLVPADEAAFNAHIASVGSASYTLRVTNSAGSATQTVELLQGIPGPSGPEGPKGIPGPSGPEGPAGTGGGTLWSCINCNGTAGTGVALDNDRMVVTVNKTDGAVASTAIPTAPLNALCADGDGCTVELGIVGYDFDGSGGLYASLDTPYMGMPCRFFLNSTTGFWTVSPHCYQLYTLYDVDHYPPAGVGDLVRMQPYESGWYGIDGKSTGDGDDNWPVLNFLQLCIFGEAGPYLNYPFWDGAKWNIIAEDNAAGFNLIASDEAWWDLDIGSACPAEPDACWTGTNRSCILIIED